MPEGWAFFIDTNIFLDFYRMPGESAKRQLQQLENNKNFLITGEQVRMEFYKNRQKVLSKTLSELKPPPQDGVPQIFSEMQAAKTLLARKKEALKNLRM